MSAEIRVFVSGTFADFQAERALLHRLVWPTIRERCATRRRRLVDIDLRWGVPANSSPRQTLLVCLSEVRRADVVVCLLGARYGWVPDAANAAAAWAELGEEGALHVHSCTSHSFARAKDATLLEAGGEGGVGVKEVASRSASGTSTIMVKRPELLTFHSNSLK